ncbi:ornithine cyclodeaminase [Paucisalibacillus sp. EB02]|uniref:ornithine cyclodeaminase n=1 Tax=Paucisalibacillus sp. EB02 TaxID=1347087 RepID=UPI0005A7284E|nr:ornithine cyclodeaminase [Paucisalibacillus sp. EB02]
MLYLSSQDMESIQLDWVKNIEVIKNTVQLLGKKHYDQPIKPYLKFENISNRIIAMPAFVGGEINKAGIKWIASFPDNINIGKKRAHSVTILNSVETGEPIAMINSPKISGIRTASVSGLVISEFQKVRNKKDITLGIVGFGPIGQLHLQMVTTLLGDSIKKIKLYDLLPISYDNIPEKSRKKVEVVEQWEDAYEDSDIFIASTVSGQGYIDKKPKDGALLLNVSLRDFSPEILNYTKSIIVDDWEEVCRENTDIEVFYKKNLLRKEETKSIIEIICEGKIKEFPENDSIMFNPMGMAVFDIAMASNYYEYAKHNKIGKQLE